MSDLISKSALLNEMKKHCGSQRYLIPESIWEMVEKFPELEGNVNLPCAVGDMTYHASRLCNRIVDAVVDRIEIDSEGIWVITTRGAHSVNDFGETVFLSLEAAKDAFLKIKGKEL